MDATSTRVISLNLLVNSTLGKPTPFRQKATKVDPVEYYGCVGVLIPSLRITDSRTQDLVARPRLVLSFFRFTSSVSFPSFGMNNARWRLFYLFLSPVVFSRTVFFRLRQLATLLGTYRSWPLAGPSALSESLLAFVVCLFIGCSCFCAVIYLPALPYCIVYISLLYLLAGYGCLVIFVRWVLYPNSSALKIGEWHSPVNLCGVFLSELTCKPIHLVEVMLRSIMSHK